MKQQLLAQIENQCRHLMSEINRDPYSPACGCFDRRYWAWKMIDLPEATFQRNVYPLAWWYKRLVQQPSPPFAMEILQAVKTGLLYTAALQHSDGSFDQAFPHEHSFGATAFLAYPLLQAYHWVNNQLDEKEKQVIQTSLIRAGEFICLHKETHGFISNHLAGAVHSLYALGKHFQESSFIKKAEEMLDFLLSKQSSEGWFPEYEGADPGYQTLAMYYLAQVYSLSPSQPLKAALEKSLQFLAWFIHPDGSFAGEYGSRRTSIYYPGGISLLATEFPLAAEMNAEMMASIIQGKTTTLLDIDMGNLAPLLSNYILTFESMPEDVQESGSHLPNRQGQLCQDFPEAGLFIRSTSSYYAIFSASNGGVIKVFDRKKKTMIYNDGGYVGENMKKQYITTQKTTLTFQCQINQESLVLEAPFYTLVRQQFTPLKLILLRILNITIMRSPTLGNIIKKIMVSMLISGQSMIPLICKRIITFEKNKLIIHDTISSPKKAKLLWLSGGVPFNAIHMASSGYFEGLAKPSAAPKHITNIQDLFTEGKIVINNILNFS